MSAADVWSAPGPEVRRPDFVVIGAMRAGTTSLWFRLDAHDGLDLPGAKEPNLFLPESKLRSLSWDGFFPEHDGRVTGEASVSYADLRHAALVAERIAAVAPEARLVYVVRDPVERLRSHYRHSYLRGAERRPIGEAADLSSWLVGRSCYDSVLAAFHEHVPTEQLHVVIHEELVGDDGAAWAGLLDHLGLERIPRPEIERNTTESKPMVNPWARRYFDSGLDRRLRGVLPARVRRAGARRLIRSAGGAEEAKDAGAGSLRDEVLERLADEVDRLEARLGRSMPWPSPVAQ